MSNPISFGIGMGLGTLLYEIIEQGIADVDWFRALFVGLFAILVLSVFRGLRALYRRLST